MSIEEARAVADAVTGLDRDTLLAERAEAEAQLRAAEATLGITPAASNGETAAEQEPDEATQKTQDVDAPDGALTLHVEELRQAAAAARAADDELAEAAAATERPGGDVETAAAESVLARSLEIQEDLPAAWRRLVGALISATGMAIVIGALGWNIYWLLVPIALIAILTVDLRLSGRAAREVSAEAAHELAAADAAEALERIRLDGASSIEEAEARLATARAEREAAYARFEELAPGRHPSEVEEIIADHETAAAAAAATESEAAARRAAADAGRMLAESLLQEEAEERVARLTAAPAPAEAPAIVVEPEAPAVPTEVAEVAAPAAAEISITEPEEAEAPAAAEISVTVPDEEPEPEPAAASVTMPEAPVEVPVTASEWWFGSTEAPAPPVAASAPVRALAERLSAEGREALARIEAQLAALERADHAKKSIEWHETNGSAEPAAAEVPPEKA